MENIKILIDGIQKDVQGIFYSFESKYYFIYTEKELDENNYVILYMVQVGRETKNTENGPVDTGYMVGIEITDPEEQKKVQTSISLIVEDKKNNTVNPLVQYLPINMLTNLKIISKKRFKLLKSIMVDNFKIQFEEEQPLMPLESNSLEQLISPIPEAVTKTGPIVPNSQVVQTIPESQLVSDSKDSLDVMAAVPLTTSNLETDPLVNNIVDQEKIQEAQVDAQSQSLQSLDELSKNTVPVVNEELPSAENVIVDYRSKYFEEEEKNKELQSQIDELTRKIEEIKKVLE